MNAINPLKWAGKNGAMIVIAGVLIGFLFPLLSDLARPYLAIAIFIFTFGSFLKFEGTSFRSEIVNVKRNALMVLWATFGIPLIAVVLISILKPGQELAQGIFFWALVPVSPACVAFSAILGLNTTIALIATVIGTAAAPFYIPALAALFGGYRLEIDPVDVCKHLAVLIGGSFAAAFLAKRIAGTFIRENPDVMTGITVSALFLAGMGSMRGMQAHLIAQPVTSIEFVLLAYVFLFGAELMGSFIFWRYGRTAALTAGLISGTRTITLAWVILGDKVLPLADLFLASSMIAKYTAPGLTKMLLAKFVREKTEAVEPATPVLAIPSNVANSP